MRIFALVVTCLLLTGCGAIYKIDVQQGNYLTQDAVDKLKPGMSKAEVRQVLGTPLLVDTFHNNRWDYFFSNKERFKSEDRKRFSVFFENDKVVSFAGTNQPPAPPPVGGPVPPQLQARQPVAPPEGQQKPAPAPKPRQGKPEVLNH